ncbi:MAG TPA: PRC-barrel domain-containing protein [Xanthobacteraceae bacterium]|nr:PRC-barrel domain-containing protein [Xanthobacteraceae bacterium]
MKFLFTAAALVVGLMISAGATATVSTPPIVMAQAMVPPTGMDDANKPMPMAERMSRRFPQPVRVGDLIGLPVLDDRSSTLGFVRQVVRTAAGKIQLIVSYSRWFGWFGRPVAVPIEAVGIEGRQLASLDMPRSEYAAAPTWQGQNATALPDDATIRIALGRN